MYFLWTWKYSSNPTVPFAVLSWLADFTVCWFGLSCTRSDNGAVPAGGLNGFSHQGVLSGLPLQMSGQFNSDILYLGQQLLQSSSNWKDYLTLDARLVGSPVPTLPVWLQLQIRGSPTHSPRISIIVLVLNSGKHAFWFHSGSYKRYSWCCGDGRGRVELPEVSSVEGSQMWVLLRQ